MELEDKLQMQPNQPDITRRELRDAILMAGILASPAEYESVEALASAVKLCADALDNMRHPQVVAELPPFPKSMTDLAPLPDMSPPVSDIDQLAAMIYGSDVPAPPPVDMEIVDAEVVNVESEAPIRG
jgi:hypothetical protein